MEIEDKLDKTVLFEQLLTDKQFDKSIISSVKQVGFQYPTVIQQKMIELYGDRLHLLTKETYYSGKSTANLIYLANHMCQLINGNVKNIYTVYLSSSRENSQKNKMIGQKLLQNTLKKKNIEIMNINDDSVYNGFDKENVPIGKHFILMSTPLSFLRFFRNKGIDSDSYVGLVIDEPEYCLSFGYLNDLVQIKEFLDNKQTLSNKLVIFGCQQEINQKVKDLKKQFMSKSVSIQIQKEEDSENEITEYKNLMVQQIYNIGSEITKYIVIYLIHKLKMIQGKTLVFCKNEDQVYQLEMFLNRCKIENANILNHKYSKNMKDYVFTIFNSGICQIMVTTQHLLDDIKNRQIGKGKYVKKHFKGLSNIIIFDFASMKDRYQDLARYFRGNQGTILSLIDNKQEEVDDFSQIIDIQKQSFKKINFKEFSLTNQEIMAFEYRINDVVKNISRKQIKLAKMVDFNKQVLKSKKLEEYFENNQNEREIIINNIRKNQQTLNQFGVRLYDDIPDYLLPEKYRYQRQLVEQSKEGKRRIVTHTLNPEYEKGLQKRLEGQNLTLDDVKKKPKNDHERYVTIDESKEDPNITAADSLKIISSRKLWKIRHRKPLKKRNYKAEKKGIFN